MKTCTAILLCCIITFNVTGQKLMHSAGATISLIKSTTVDEWNPDYSEDRETMVSNITYFPRYNFVSLSNSSISVGAPVGVGLGVAKSTYGETLGLSFSYDLPVCIDFNIGRRSTSDNDKGFGGYIGAGYGYQSVSVSGARYSDLGIKSHGPMLRAGVRFNPLRNGEGFTVGFFYKKGMETMKNKSFGMNLLIELG